MFKQWVEKLTAATTEQHNDTTDMRQISAQLLMEVARCDTSISVDEREQIMRAVQLSSGLTDAELNDILTEAEESVDTLTSFHQHVRLINEHFSREQKIDLIEQMWRVAYIDDSLDHHEEAFIRQISDLIYVRHREFMQAKLRVIEGNQ